MFRTSKGAAALMLAAALILSAISPASAFFWHKAADEPRLLDFSKNGTVGTEIRFQPEDFVTEGDDSTRLRSITITSLPDPELGELTLAGQPLRPGVIVESTALSGLCFALRPDCGDRQGSFTCTALYYDHEPAKRGTTVSLYALTRENHMPVAQNLSLHTYTNVPVTGYFSARDPENDVLTYSLTSLPARGSVSVEEGGSAFVYTPYENKTGRDSFTFVARDTAGNTSPEATATIRIDKAATKVTYADMEGHPAQKAAIHLAERGLYVGASMNGTYFFQPEQTVSRAKFLTLAMDAVGREPSRRVTLTGFYDDEAIPTWAKGYVSAALRQGTIQGTRDEYGAPVFLPQEAITQGEAMVMLDQLLEIADVPVQVFSPGQSHWAAQAMANLTASGFLPPARSSIPAAPMTLGDAAQLLDQVLELRE